MLVANTLVTPKNGKIPVKFINVGKKGIDIENCSVKIHYAKDYSIANFERPKIIPERVKNLFKELKLDGLNTEELK